jgi:cell division septum initiation protein DivIVA
MRRYFSFLLPILVAASLYAQTAPPPTSQTPRSTTKAKPAARAKKKAAPSEVQLLRNALEIQQKDIQQLRDDLRQRDSAVQQLQQQINALRTATQQAQTAAQNAANTSEQNSAVLTQVQTSVNNLKASGDKVPAEFQKADKRIAELERPTQIRFRGVTITPGGFLAANTVVRARNENADVLDTYGNVPFTGTTNSHLSEFRFTARHSRLSLLFEGRIHDWKSTGYYEMDFEGGAPTANEVQTNSYQPRIRQLWANLDFQNGVSFLGGQAWSLMTMHRKGLAPRSELIPLTISASYNVGMTYGRQTTFRVTKNFRDKAWLAFGVENAETVLSQQGLPASVAVFGFSNSPNAQSPNNGFTLSNTPGATGISTDLSPDLVAKLAFEPGWGHYEVKAVGRFFRDRTLIAGVGTNNRTQGGGIGLGILLPVVANKADFFIEGLGGRGIGRYGTANGADVTLRPDGSIVPILSFQTLAGLELHPTSKWDLYVYGGNEYFGRSAYTTTSGTMAVGVGYGSLLNNLTGCSVETAGATCQAQNRDVWQVTPGFWYRVWKGREGTIQYGTSWGYAHRRAWAGRLAAGTLAPIGINNIVMTSLRYYFP